MFNFNVFNMKNYRNNQSIHINIVNHQYLLCIINSNKRNKFLYNLGRNNNIFLEKIIFIVLLIIKFIELIYSSLFAIHIFIVLSYDADAK